jgi:hypothetical protein
MVLRVKVVIFQKVTAPIQKKKKLPKKQRYVQKKKRNVFNLPKTKKNGVEE